MPHSGGGAEQEEAAVTAEGELFRLARRQHVDVPAGGAASSVPMVLTSEMILRYCLSTTFFPIPCII